MSRVTKVSVSSQTTSNPVVIDHLAENFAVGFAVTIGGGTLTYDVEHTFDDIFDPAVTPVWFDHSSVVAKVNVNADGNYAFPVRAIRLNVTAWTSGTATLTVIQSR
jgi:hypothetical protein